MRHKIMLHLRGLSLRTTRGYLANTVALFLARGSYFKSVLRPKKQVPYVFDD